MTAILSPLGWLYGKIVDARNVLYDRGLLRSYPLGATTISIGNLTTGGTGKTPLVALVAEMLADGGEKVCILTRGYGRNNPGRRVLVSDGETVLADAQTAGDEPAELAGKLIGKAIVVADADRVAAAKWAKEKFGVTAFVLDDAFQHRRAKRDVDIVCIDATNPFGGAGILPAGRLREPLRNLRRAGAIVITRADLARPTRDRDRDPSGSPPGISDLKSDISNLEFGVSDLRSRIAALAPGVPIFICVTRLAALTEIGEPRARSERTSSRDLSIAMSHPQDRRSFAFCALGNPEVFFLQLEREGFPVVGKRTFRDHHFYRQSDIEEVEALARDAGAGMLLTTAKDAVKLTEMKFGIPCFIVEIEPIIEPFELFRKMLF